jgi:NADH:ubiquinone oxidoreductase subunit F (NADH-binding)
MLKHLANIPAIIRNGAEWYKSIGTPSSPGTKVYTILGNVNVTGLIEVPMGITLREVISHLRQGYEGWCHASNWRKPADQADRSSPPAYRIPHGL